MPRRKPKEAEPVQPTEKPVEVPPEKPAELQTKKPVARTEYTIREATWEEFESFQPSQQRKERSKSPLREAFEMAVQGKVVKIEGLTPAQVRAVLALVNQWNYKEKLESGREPVRVKYDMKAGVVYLAPAEKPEEKQ